MAVGSVDVVVFDLGNVLLTFRPRDFLLEHTGDHELAEELHRIIFRTPEWLALDRGSFTREQAIAVLGERHPQHAGTICWVLVNWTEAIVRPIPGTVKILKALKRHCAVDLYILSNFHLEAYEEVRARYDFFELFDGGVISARVGMLKPEEGIYRVLVERYGLAPERTLFIDDLEENTRKAAKMGLKVLRFEDPRTLAVDLRALGFDLPDPGCGCFL